MNELLFFYMLLVIELKSDSAKNLPTSSGPKGKAIIYILN